MRKAHERPEKPLGPPPRLPEDEVPPAPAPEEPASPHVRFMPMTASLVPDTGDEHYKATDKQARFKETAVACVAIGETTFPTWRLQHERRCAERVSTVEWTAWNTEPSFVRWFCDGLAWDLTDVDRKMLDTRYYQAMDRRLAAYDPKAMEIHAKETKKIGDNTENQGAGLVSLLNWARGLGAAGEARHVIDTTATTVPEDVDAWKDARVEKK